MKRLCGVIVIGGALLSAVACGGSPTAPPPPVPVLRLDPDGGLTVARRETGQLRAWYGVPGAQQEITSAATWSTSNPEVATVRAGVVTGVGPGTASIAAEYQGERQTVAITIRRRTALAGRVLLSDTQGRQTLVILRAFVEGREVGYHATSHALVSLGVDWDEQLSSFEASIAAPGSREVAVDVQVVGAQNLYASDPVSRVRMIDFDTLELLASVALPVQQKPLSTGDRMTWTVQVPVFSS